MGPLTVTSSSCAGGRVLSRVDISPATTGHQSLRSSGFSKGQRALKTFEAVCGQ